MRTFFLFVLLSSLLRNPILALIVVAAVAYLIEARVSGRWFNPARFFNRKSTIRELKHRVALNPHDAEAHNDLGRLLVDEGDPAAARAHLEKAVERMDDSPETLYFLGRALLGTGASEEGVERIRAALALKPQFLYGEPQTALARHFAESGDHARAEEWAAEAVRINTSNVEGWFLLGRAHQSQGRSDEARKAYEKAADAFTHLPRYLRMANRKWRSRARRGVRALG